MLASVPSNPKKSHSSSSSQSTFSRADFQFLPQIHEILLSIQNGDSAQEIGKKIITLQESFKKALNILESLPGHDSSILESEKIQTGNLSSKRISFDFNMICRKEVSSYLELPLFKGVNHENQNKDETQMEIDS
ncbi:hypothetical protein BKA69DRAFT_1123323 [Paraphysoderma sedebokerense]|nr:hypothetical protein BKA69DRAFT_1123323 [Paraphysoderma sedebokerense]